MVPYKPSHKPKVQVVDVFIDFEYPTITLEIGHHHISGVQLDGGAAVDLMTKQTMNELGLTNLKPTNIILCVANQQ